ncbi:hypothetical protein DFA_03760 [Cavenderia fasciculata]|uniref:Transmembrane protein n=1 Tax=Cavenderia fasciculata TaxID=261658 RepID=F4Q0B7_CACFS|nr:uncharacterized protein DFA_03760 [Cavenderia fasciculata]EGG18268.1 hypothetical protein DFA_03760 [Cavenderia fasciculata]|eukprot:XP_004357091.1 hypothetical protein DFA_03760 [Cavenderia fasciculata]
MTKTSFCLNILLVFSIFNTLYLIMVAMLQFLTIDQTIIVRQYIGENLKQNNQEFRALLPTSDCLDYQELMDEYRNRTELDKLYSQELIFSSLELKITSKEKVKPNRDQKKRLECDQNANRSKFKHFTQLSLPITIFTPFDVIAHVVYIFMIRYPEETKFTIIQLSMQSIQFFFHFFSLYYYTTNIIPSIRNDFQNYPICFEKENNQYHTFCKGEIKGNLINFQNFELVKWDFSKMIIYQLILSSYLFISIIKSIISLILKN